METHTVICHETSDVKNFVVESVKDSHLVHLAVIEADANPNVDFDAVPILTAQLLPSQAIRLARCLLDIAGVHGTWKGNAQTFVFID